MVMVMKTASEIIDYLGGRDAVAAVVGVQNDAVRIAESKGYLPAPWYHLLENMAGRPLPRECFTFKRRPNE